MADSRNKILLFAPSATKSSDSGVLGNYYADSVWESNATRDLGAKQGIAHSIEYNTALRQASFMASILAEGLVKRFNSDVSAEGSKLDLESRVANFGAKFTKGNFILPGEINETALDTDAVTTVKIKDKQITPAKLGTIVANKRISASSNGISVTLSQADSTGLSIALSSTAVQKADAVNIPKASGTTYLCGKDTTGEAYASPKYIDTLTVNTDGSLVSSSSIEATSFNATSDIRLKDNIKTSDMDATNIVDTIDIVDFNYKATPDVKQFGVIAQSLKEVCPEVVVKGEDGYLRIKESKLVYILWKALQDANERIANLEAIVYSKVSNK